MAHFFVNRYEREGLPKKEDKPALKIIASAKDYLNEEPSIDLINDSKLKNYALQHPEQNMVQLFSKLNYTIPKNQEEFDDPKFNGSFIFKRDNRGNIVPRENIYWNQKHVKNYQNSQSSFYSLLAESNECERDKASLHSIEKMFKKNQKRRKLDKSQCKICRERKSYRPSLNKDNTEEKKLLIYNACIMHYSEELDNKPIKNITLDDFKDLGQIYYIIKIASNPKEQNTNWENDNNSNNNIIPEKELFNIKYISSLYKNSIITKQKFGPFSYVKGDSQIIAEEIAKIKIETQNLLGIKSNNILFDKYTIFLILKAKRIKLDDILSRNQNYFKFYVEGKLIPCPVKVKFYSKCSREKIDNFHSIMKKIKINEELFIAFAFNPTYYFDNYHLRYENKDVWEYVYYVDSSKANPKVEEIFNEINNN